ncbi:hypothetical protein [uncultured Spongiibacter sp.]|uniref:hypothetical protein n=1 Tax=uncultured Spongiibacter sp. TaxID=870896 RepID=UPI002596CE66|nr:hypothetical protein [uncultured Spongiibacter sp.]
MDVDQLIKIMRVAAEAGLRSPEQKAVFLEIARAGETNILELSGCDNTLEPEAKRIRGAIGPLTKEGMPRSGGSRQAGLGLVNSRPGRFITEGSTRPLNGYTLTPKGRRYLIKMDLAQK